MTLDWLRRYVYLYALAGAFVYLLLTFSDSLRPPYTTITFRLGATATILLVLTMAIKLPDPLEWIRGRRGRE